MPGARFGNPVAELPEDVRRIYDEARDSIAARAFTGAAMLCRNILMHVAVEKGAPQNRSFLEYVEWLVDEHYVPKGGEGWVDYIRTRGNEANHEIAAVSKQDAEAVLRFTEELLRMVYELPAAIPQSP